LILRHAWSNPDFEFVAVNDLTDAPTLAHLLKYDSVHGRFGPAVKAVGEAIEIDGKPLRVMAKPNPADLPWKELGVDLVFECSGHFTTKEKASAHCAAGARWVLISAPGKGVDATIVYGVNHDILDPARHTVVSNGSCTTNCLAPVVKVVKEAFGIEYGLLTTVHAMTNDQRLLDLPHKDLRRARAAGMSMIPTSTGAARAMSEVYPELKGKLDGMSIRVPTHDVSVVDFTFTTEKPMTLESLNGAFKAAAEGSLAGVMEFCEEPLVSIDFQGNPHSSIIDAKATVVIGDRMAKVLAWYDNEFAYAVRCVDVAGLFK